jgi:hypothetical protein
MKTRAEIHGIRLGGTVIIDMPTQDSILEVPCEISAVRDDSFEIRYPGGQLREMLYGVPNWRIIADQK